MALYAYCLSDAVTGGMLGDGAGVAGCAPRLLQCGDVAVVVSEFEGERVTVERENVFAHERVIRSVLQHVTPLPFRFGTLTSEESLAAYVEENRDRLMKNLRRVRDCVEMSVKFIWDANEARSKGAEAQPRGHEDEKDERKVAGKGTAYLAARRREIVGEALLKERAEELAEWLAARVGAAARERDVMAQPSESLVVRAAFLVPRAGLEDYRRRVSEARRERSHLRFLTSGPWPPYSFSSIKPLLTRDGSE